MEKREKLEMQKAKKVSYVSIAMEISDDLKAEILAFVQAHGYDTVQYCLDKEIMGGIIIRLGDEVYDGSVKSKLIALKQSI